LYVSPEAAARFNPPVVGWRNTITDLPLNAEVGLRAGAARFEAGSPNILGIAGLAAALRLLTDAGLPEVHDRLIVLGSAITCVLRRHQLVDPNWNPLSHLLSIPMAPEAARVLYTHLEDARISSSLRYDGKGRAYLRFAPHFYNDESDVERLDEALGNW
jgi:selenocysteine lyase/cysteine desulfurase